MRVGITGHQELGSHETKAWIRGQIHNALNKENFACGVTSLAAGADQLFACVVLELSRPIEVIVPCGRYEEAFTNPIATKLFRRLRGRATHCYTLPFCAPSDDAFYQAGKRVVETSDSLIAVWNGKPAAGLGGTADIVRYAIECRREVLHINPATLTTRLLNANPASSTSTLA